MRSLLACLLGLGLAGLAAAQEKKPAQPATRYGVSADLDTYPQSSAKEALRFVHGRLLAANLGLLEARLRQAGVGAPPRAIRVQSKPTPRPASHSPCWAWIS